MENKKILFIYGLSLSATAQKVLKIFNPNITYDYPIDYHLDLVINEKSLDTYNVFILLIPSNLLLQENYFNQLKFLHEYALNHPNKRVISFFTIEEWSDDYHKTFSNFEIILISSIHEISNTNTIAGAINARLDKYEFLKNYSPKKIKPEIAVKLPFPKKDNYKEEFIETIHECKKLMSPEFHVFYKGTEWPEEFWTLTHVKNLTFSFTPHLKEIPSDIRKFENLQEIMIYTGGPRKLPPEISELENLRTIIVYDQSEIDVKSLCFNPRVTYISIMNCKLKKIPAEIKNVKLLRFFTLSKNELVELPEEIGELRNLMSLDCGFNRITKIPQNIYKLKELQFLNLHGNKLKDLPISLSSLSNLRELNLKQNRIEYIPKEFYKFKNHINIFDFTGNPLSKMPELLDMSLYKVFEHLDSLRGVGKQSIEWKVPDTIVTPFQQYLNYFRDFTFEATGEKIKFDVLVTDAGLKLITEPTEAVPIDRINELLTEFISQNTRFEETQHFTKEQVFKMQIMLHDYQTEIAQLNRKIVSQAQKIKYLGDRILKDEEVQKKMTVTGRLFNDPTPRKLEIQLTNDETQVHFHFHEALRAIGTGSSFNPDVLLTDLLDKSIRMMERKSSCRLEDLHNDEVVNFMRDRGFAVYDQTRSGRSAKTVGELDMMVRKENGTPVCIIEALRSNSCGPKDKDISYHINKLLHDYDTAGHQVNFILVYFEGKNFGKYWENYKSYLSNLNNKPEFSGPHKLISFSDTRLSTKTDVKVGLANHIRNGEHIKVYHIVINMAV